MFSTTQLFDLPYLLSRSKPRISESKLKHRNRIGCSGAGNKSTEVPSFLTAANRHIATSILRHPDIPGPSRPEIPSS